MTVLESFLWTKIRPSNVRAAKILGSQLSLLPTDSTADPELPKREPARNGKQRQSGLHQRLLNGTDLGLRFPSPCQMRTSNKFVFCFIYTTAVTKAHCDALLQRKLLYQTFKQCLSGGVISNKQIYSLHTISTSSPMSNTKDLSKLLATVKPTA